MRLTGKMIVCFLIVVCVSSIGFGLVIYESVETQYAVTDVYEEEIPRLIMINEIVANSLIEAASIRGYLLTHDEKMVDEYKKSSDENDRLEAELLKGVRTEERRKAIQFISDTDDKYSEILDKKVIPLVREGKIAEAIEANNEADQHSAALLKAVTDYRQTVTDVTNKALVDSIGASNDSIKISIISAIISAVLGITIAIFSARSIAGKVGQLAELAKSVAGGNLTHTYRGVIDKDEIGDLATALNSMVSSLKQLVSMISGQAQNIAASSEELTASADQSAQASAQVAGSITEVANGTGKQLDSVKMTNGVVENMVAELEEVSANIGLVADKAGKTAEMATTGGKSANRAITQMNELEKTVSESARVVAQLGERSQEIGQIVDTISSIAGQTNLLALNAAIEAARAGEQGRGFAVVAEEVRKLAEQSQEAAKRIAGLIGEIQVETTRAVSAMDNGTREVKIGAEVVNETGISFQEIIGLVNQVSEQTNSIAKVVQSVAEGSEKIVASVQDISDLSNAAAGEIQTVSAATEEQSASMQEIAAASQNLSKLAQSMQETVERFRI